MGSQNGIALPVRTSSEIVEVLRECYADTRKFCRAFLSDNFYTPFVSEIHDPIFSLIDTRKDQKMTAVCATRGIGKSTIARGIGAKGICYADRNFIVYLGKSSTHAEMQTENLKKDLMSEEIKRVFGNVKARVPGDVEESWSKKSWVAMVGELCQCGKTSKSICAYCGGVGDAHYTFVLPRGAGQQVRGLLWKSPDGMNVRPDLIIADDLEDSELIDSEDWRAKIKEWFFSDVMHCFPKLEKDWEIFYIDTLKHEDSLMALLLESPDWDTRTISACDTNYKSLAPGFMSDDEIQGMVESYRQKGLMDVFAREIMCVPISREDAEFKSDYFQYYAESDKDFVERQSRMVNVLLVDPARTANLAGSESGLIVWGIDLESNLMYLRFASGEKLHPDELINRTIELAQQYKVWVIGIEDTGLAEFATYPLDNELLRRGLTFPVEPLRAKRGGPLRDVKGFESGKVKRIRSLSAYYRQGLVKHNKVGIGAYEIQLLGFPKSKRWDMIDSAAYITQMLDRGKLYMLIEGLKEESPEDVEKEYVDMEAELIEEDKLMQEEWRTAP